MEVIQLVVAIIRNNDIEWEVTGAFPRFTVQAVAVPYYTIKEAVINLQPMFPKVLDYALIFYVCLMIESCFRIAASAFSGWMLTASSLVAGSTKSTRRTFTGLGVFI